MELNNRRGLIQAASSAQQSLRQFAKTVSEARSLFRARPALHAHIASLLPTSLSLRVSRNPAPRKRSLTCRIPAQRDTWRHAVRYKCFLLALYWPTLHAGHNLGPFQALAHPAWRTTRARFRFSLRVSPRPPVVASIERRGHGPLSPMPTVNFTPQFSSLLPVAGCVTLQYNLYLSVLPLARLLILIPARRMSFAPTAVSLTVVVAS